MKNKLLYLLLLLLISKGARSQNRLFLLEKGGCIRFKSHVYCFGLKQDKAQLCIYQLSPQLQTTDSLFVPLKHASTEYLRVYADTTHNYLNIYLPLTKNNRVNVVRINNFSITSIIENVDVARLNNSSMFGSEAYVSGNSVYDIKTQPDSAGKQFFLNKFELKAVNENFDYSLKWQYAFERKNIRSAHVFYANPKKVMMYVMVDGGNNKGQWILHIDAGTGQLIKASLVGDRKSGSAYYFGNHYYNTAYKSMTIFGQKSANMDADPGSTGTLTMYCLQIDSTGNKTGMHEFKIPITEIAVQGKKGPVRHLGRVTNAEKTSDGYVLETDLYMRTNECYRYVNTHFIKLAETEEGLKMEKIVFSSNPLIEGYYSRDKKDMNGMLCGDSAGLPEKYFYRDLPLPVKLCFRKDENGNSLYLLTRSDLQRNNINYSVIGTDKKKFVIKSMADIQKQNSPNLVVLPGNKFIVCSDSGTGMLELKLFSW